MEDGGLMSGLTQARLKEFLHYDPETGEFTWIKGRRGTSAGRKAGCLAPTGYLKIRVDQELCQAHRLAWLWMTGEWPQSTIDHRDGNPSNNRWNNLRAATRAENSANCKRPVTNKTGFKGVHIHQGRYRARLSVNNKTVSIGMFSTAEAAHEAYKKAALRQYGEFANFGDVD